MNKLSTKANTLQLLYERLQFGKVLPQYSFTVGEWIQKREAVLEQYARLSWKDTVIVRSSSLSEDTRQGSNAGKYESVANVAGTESLICAIDQVMNSYDDRNPENQILIQPMLKEVWICGVAFTADPNTGGHYYVINYDETGSTDQITSGNVSQNFLYYQFKEADCHHAKPEIRQIVQVLQELEDFFGEENLDVEFAVTVKNEIYVLQVRHLCMNEEQPEKARQFEELKRIRKKVEQDQSKKPFLCGEKAVYGVMTDWNPAEMIGIRPKPLAKSLYQEVITDSVWAYQRHNYGYRNLRSFPLMVDFGGLSYIDIRVSFNSFVPAGLEEEISEKLVNYYLDRLVENPQKHDKAEFDIVFSCYTLDLPERIQVLKEYGFTTEEIEKILSALRDVTNQIIDHEKGLWRKDYDKIAILNKRYDEILSSNMGQIEKIYWLLEDCKRYGTLPFAGLARAAFIAVQILQSFVNCGIMSEHDYELFFGGINTVSSNMNQDFKELTRSKFLKKYGHLRPGTYDITSRRYDEAPDLYFDWETKVEDAESEQPKEIFRLSLDQLNAIKRKQMENGLTNDILELMDFIRIVIEGREYGKFHFTRNLSKAIQMIHEIGETAGLSEEDCSFINIQTIRGLYSSTKDIESSLFDSVAQGKKEYESTKAITLPPLIVKSEEIMGFYYPDSEPNFITSGKIEGIVSLLKAQQQEDISGKIVLIPSADPGYDWIFSKGIKGFITMYGGANSHMAIRAGELGIPAVVGVGTKAFEQYRKAKYIEIDASGKMIRILKL